MKMRVIDLFCGAGGFSYGMHKAGHHVVAAIDYEGRPLAVHKANVRSVASRWTLAGLRYAVRNASWKGGHRRADLTDVLAMAPDIVELNPDVIVGGPPCQPWSKSGKRLGDADPRAKLTEAFGIIVAVARPRYFVLENVPGIRGSKVFQRMKDIVGRAGYGLTEMVVNTGDYGTAQSRDRFLCIGALGEAEGWFHDYMREAKSARSITVAEVLPDFGVLLCRQGGRWVPAGAAKVDTSSSRRRGYRLREADIRFLEKAGDKFTAYWRYPGGRSSGGIRRTDERAPTIIKSSGGGPGKKYRPGPDDVIDLRLLPVPSLDQLSQMAGFPAGWNWRVRAARGSLRDDHGHRGKSLSPIQMLANAVPPPLAESIGRCLQAHARKHIPVVARPDWQVPEAYTEWLARTGNLADDVMAQQISDLREAKLYVGGHQLSSTDAEILAFNKVAAIAHGDLNTSHRSKMLTALRSFATWERYTRSLPSERDVKKVVKAMPFLRNYPAPLIADLAALEIDTTWYDLSSERRAECREELIALFQNGDPTPYWTFNAPSPYRDPVDDDDDMPTSSLRLSGHSRIRSGTKVTSAPLSTESGA